MSRRRQWACWVTWWGHFLPWPHLWAYWDRVKSAGRRTTSFIIVDLNGWPREAIFCLGCVFGDLWWCIRCVFDFGGRSLLINSARPNRTGTISHHTLSPRCTYDLSLKNVKNTVKYSSYWASHFTIRCIVTRLLVHELGRCDFTTNLLLSRPCCCHWASNCSALTKCHTLSPRYMHDLSPKRSKT